LRTGCRSLSREEQLGKSALGFRSWWRSLRLRLLVLLLQRAILRIPAIPHSKQPIQATRLLGRIHLLWLIRLLGMQRLILERRQGTQLLLQAILRRATRLIHRKLLLAILRRATRPTRPKLFLDILLHRATQVTRPKLLLDILLRRAIHLRKATASPILDNSFWGPASLHCQYLQ